jgi:hypothetical protein
MIRERLRPLISEQVLDFISHIKQLPDGLALGIHGTTDIALPSIWKQGLQPRTSYYRLDPNLDAVLQRDLQRKDWEKILKRLERTLEHAAQWGETASPRRAKYTVVIVFVAEPRTQYLGLEPGACLNDDIDPHEYPSAQSARVYDRDLISRFDLKKGESPGEFSRRVARGLIKIRFRAGDVAKYMFEQRAYLRSWQS